MEPSNEALLKEADYYSRAQQKRQRAADQGGEIITPHGCNQHDAHNSWSFSCLPLPIQRHIAYFLSAHKVYTASELDKLVQFYPLEYLCVELSVTKAEVEAMGLLLSREPQLLREVVVLQMDYSEGAPLVKELLQLESLECLSLQLHRVDSTCAERLVRRCCKSRNKHHFLDLDLSMLSADRASDLVEELVRGDMSLTYLDLRYIDGWKDAHNKYLKSLMSSTLQLSHLVLLGVEFDKLGVVLLANALAANCSLEGILFGDGPIFDEGVALIGEALSRNSVLQRFRGFNLGMTSVGAVKFFNSLMSNTTLEYLSFKDEDVGEEGAIAVAKLLEVNCSLRTVGFSYCDLGLHGCNAIVDAIEKNTSLEEIWLNYCGISNADSRRLQEMDRKSWWVPEINEKRFVNKATYRRAPIFRQHRSDFKTNFREYLACTRSGRA